MTDEVCQRILNSIQNMEVKFQKSMDDVNLRVDELTARTQDRPHSCTPSPK